MDSPGASAQPQPDVRLTPKKILLVEDDDNLATTYLTRLQLEGFEVRREPDGEKA
jgi:DNA-binding NtrC family response regulator